MEAALMLLIVCLLVVILYLLVRGFLFRKNLRSFTREVKSLKDGCYMQPIKVDCYDKDIVSLANALNEHIEDERELMLKYLNDKKELSNIISGVSHDFRTPLTASLGYLQMLSKSKTLSDDEREYLSIAIDKNNYVKALSDDFFEISKHGDSTNIDFEPERINISNLLSECLLEQYTWIEQSSLRTEIDIKDAIFINSDSHALRRIIQNLFTNAQKYSLSYLGVKLYEGDGKAVLQVYNDSEETASIDTEKIFEAFYRSESRSKPGSGLGLYICRRLAKRIGASIYAEKNNNEIKFTVII